MLQLVQITRLEHSLHWYIQDLQIGKIADWYPVEPAAQLATQEPFYKKLEHL